MGKKYKRLAGIEGAKKEGYTHTNQARVVMTPEEELEKKLQPASDKDVETIRKGLEKELKKTQKDPDPELS